MTVTLLSCSIIPSLPKTRTHFTEVALSELTIEIELTEVY